MFIIEILKKIKNKYLLLTFKHSHIRLNTILIKL